MSAQLGAIDGLLVDLDGVVWSGTDELPGAIEALNALARQGVTLVFLTNDPVGRRGDVARRLTALGHRVDATRVVTASSTTASQLAGSSSAALVIGPPVLAEELQTVGIRAASGADADVVVVGGGTDLRYDDLCSATIALHRGARFAATGRDPWFPTAEGPWPATGAVVALLETASGRQATVFGKPAPFMFRAGLAAIRHARRVAVVGDRVDSDVVGGQGVGLLTVHVGTGSDGGADAQTPSFAEFALRLLHARRIAC